MSKKIGRGKIHTAFPGTILGVFFVVGGVWAVLAASGYKFNLASGSITQTAVIVLSGSESNVTVSLDGTVIANRITTIRGVSVGSHDVSITSLNHQPWRESFRLKAGEAALGEHVELFLSAPAKLDVQVATNSLDNVDLVDSTLRVEGTELFQVTKSGNELVTRFSQPILSAVRSNDQEHIFFQIGKMVYVTELQGENTAKLIELSDSTPTPIVARQNDSQLVLKNSGALQTWQIR